MRLWVYQQFITGVGTFYGDYKNLSICFNVALNIVIKEINGMKQQDVIDWAQRMRSVPTTSSCDSARFF